MLSRPCLFRTEPYTLNRSLLPRMQNGSQWVNVIRIRCIVMRMMFMTVDSNFIIGIARLAKVLPGIIVSVITSVSWWNGLIKLCSTLYSFFYILSRATPFLGFAWPLYISTTKSLQRLEYYVAWLIYAAWYSFNCVLFSIGRLNQDFSWIYFAKNLLAFSSEFYPTWLWLISIRSQICPLIFPFRCKWTRKKINTQILKNVSFRYYYMQLGTAALNCGNKNKMQLLVQ